MAGLHSLKVTPAPDARVTIARMPALDDFNLA